MERFPGLGAPSQVRITPSSRSTWIHGGSRLTTAFGRSAGGRERKQREEGEPQEAEQALNSHSGATVFLTWHQEWNRAHKASAAEDNHKGQGHPRGQE